MNDNPRVPEYDANTLAALEKTITAIHGIQDVDALQDILGVVIETLRRIEERVTACEASLIGAGVPLMERK